MKKHYQILIIAILILAAYYPTSMAGIIKIDDFQLFQRLDTASGVHLRSIFFPSVSDGYYYRPIIALSYLLDKHVLNLLPGLMHEENVLLHVLNAILVFLLTLRMMPMEVRKTTYTPLAAALLFGLHPIATESVNWISGRTDVLAATFVLLSTHLLIVFMELRKPSWMVLSLCCFLCAVLTKETSLAFLPGFAFLLMTDMNRTSDSDLGGSTSYRLKTAQYPAALLGLLAVVAIFVLLRLLAFTSHTSRIGITMRAIGNDWIHSFLVVLRAFGFYLKKLVMPFPLNFAILEVDPLYEILAVPLVVLCVYIALRRTLRAAIFTTGVCLIAPAFLLAFSQLAWTPYAERYVYVSSSFLVIAAALYARDFFRSPYVKAVTAGLLAVMLITTFARSSMWKNDYLLVKDTVEKSPLSRGMRGLYAAMLAERGEYEEALMQIEQGSKLPSTGKYDALFDMTKAYIAAMQGKNDDAIELYRDIMQNAPHRSGVVLPNLIQLLNVQKQTEPLAHKKRSLERQILLYNIRLYEITPEPYLLNRIGNEIAAIGSVNDAVDFYRRTLRRMSPVDPFRQSVEKRLKKTLSAQMGRTRATVN